MRTQNEHVDSARLQALLHESHAGADVDQTMRHLDSCPDCRAALEAAAGGPAWWSEAQSSLSHDDLGDASLTQFGSNARRLDGARSLLSYIAVPSEDPDNLGRIGN